MRVVHPATTLQGVALQTPEGHAGSLHTVRLMRDLVRQARMQPAIIAAAHSIVGLAPAHDFAKEARALFDFVTERVRYVRDVHEVETLTAPVYVLERMSGDCDDKSALLASLCEAIGFPTRFVIAGYTGPLFQHVYLQILIDDVWVNADPTAQKPLGWEAPNATVYWVERV